MNRDYNVKGTVTGRTPSKRKSRWTLRYTCLYIFTFTLMPWHYVCVLIGMVANAGFNGLVKGWRTRF